MEIEMNSAVQTARSAGGLFAQAGVAKWPDLVAAGTLGAGWGLIKRGGYSPSPDGDDQRLILVACHERGELVDIAAFNPARPSAGWATRAGMASIVGLDAIERAKNSVGWGSQEAPLKLHPSPLEWLRNSCEGAALISVFDHQARMILRECKSITVENQFFARRLQNELARVRVPAIRVEVRA